jgi:hypothetical protein
MPRIDFELQHARMTVLHSERDDFRLEKAALLSRCDILLAQRKTLLAEMQDFAAVARDQSRVTARFLLECEAGASR